MPMKLFLSAILFSFITSACTKENKMPVTPVINHSNSNSGGSFSYLALGDSYTIGESVPQGDSFPYQLQALLNASGKKTETPKIIAKTGWTTDELQAAINQAKITQKFDFVTLLIGVNNQYRGYPIDTYKKEFTELLKTAIAFANGKAERVFVVSIPDWGVTPFAKGSAKSAQTIATEIDIFNKANEEITLQAGARYTNITPDSRKASDDVSLIAADGLHPSGKMYSNWSNALLSQVVKSLE